MTIAEAFGQLGENQIVVAGFTDGRDHALAVLPMVVIHLVGFDLELRGGG